SSETGEATCADPELSIYDQRDRSEVDIGTINPQHRAPCTITKVIIRGAAPSHTVNADVCTKPQCSVRYGVQFTITKKPEVVDIRRSDRKNVGGTQAFVNNKVIKICDTITGECPI